MSPILELGSKSLRPMKGWGESKETPGESLQANMERGRAGIHRPLGPVGRGPKRCLGLRGEWPDAVSRKMGPGDRAPSVSKETSSPGGPGPAEGPSPEGGLWSLL